MFSLPNIIESLSLSDGHVAEDLIDKLNSQVTVYVLAFFAVVTGGKQNFGTPLQCMAPAESVDSWVKYYHDYCYIHNNLRMDPGDFATAEDFVMNGGILRPKPVYYQWVPYVLVLQAVFFLLPRIFWKFAGTSLSYSSDIENVIIEAALLHKSKDDERQKDAKTLAKYASATLDFKGKKSLCGYTFTLCYVLRKWFAFLNVLFQFILLAYLITAREGIDFLWGWHILYESLYPFPNSDRIGFFPTVIRCDIARLEVGFNENWNSMQCVLMMNFINEKIFILIYFWLIGLAFINLLVAVRFSVFFAVAPYRDMIARTLIPSLNVLMESTPDLHNKHIEGRYHLDHFIRHVLRADGILTLMFIYNHAGGFITFELAQQLWNESKGPSDKKNPLDASIERLDAGKDAKNSKKPRLLPSVDEEKISALEDLLEPKSPDENTLPLNSIVGNEYV